LVSRVLDHCYDHGAILDSSNAGQAIENCYVESFNGRFREECLNTY
jgi:putative transposase